MLREIPAVRQVPGEERRRWFTSDSQDLIVWLDAAGKPSGFQFCYDKGKPGQAEHALTWRTDSGMSHLAVDDGESRGALNYKATPMLMPNGELDSARVARLFDAAAATLPQEIREFVLAKIGASNKNG